MDKYTTALIDGDMLIYKAACASEVETRWEDNIWTLQSDENQAVAITRDLIAGVLSKLRLTKCILFFTTGKLFRHEIYPDYKSNRLGKRKPLGLSAIRARMMADYESVIEPRLEADDVIGIYATADPYSVAVSGDKDFATLPCNWYNHLTEEMKVTTLEEANYNHLIQSIAGDATDGFAGIKGFGVKTAAKHLDKHGATWESVVSLYESKGLTEEDALLTARLAYILRDGDYNKTTKEITLWTPTQLEKK